MADPAARTKTEPSSYTINLHIKHPAIDPAAITRELGLTPDHSWACGEPKRSASGTSSGVRRNSFWCATLPPLAASAATFFPGAQESARFQRALDMVSGDLGSQLNTHLLRLHRHQGFIQKLLDEGGEVSFVVELPADPAGFKLDAALSRMLGALGATLEFQFE